VSPCATSVSALGRCAREGKSKKFKRSGRMPLQALGECEAVDTLSGQTIIAGDAAMNVRYNVLQLIPPGFLDNMTETMNHLRRLAHEGKHILYTHDDEVFELYPEGVS